LLLSLSSSSSSFFSSCSRSRALAGYEPSPLGVLEGLFRGPSSRRCRRCRGTPSRTGTVCSVPLASRPSPSVRSFLEFESRNVGVRCRLSFTKIGRRLRRRRPSLSIPVSPLPPKSSRSSFATTPLPPLAGQTHLRESSPLTLHPHEIT
jgi:hypothetical protein